MQTFEKTFGGSVLRSHLSSKNVPDDYKLNLDKDKQLLVTLKTLMSSHFVHRYDKDYDNLRLELKRVKLQWYFPGGIVVKEGYDIYDMICEILPENSVAYLRSRLCKYLTVNIDYFGSLFQEEFAPKEINMYDYIGKQVRSTTVHDHNAVFALSKMLKESFFIIGVRHNWKSANSPNIDIVLGYIGNKKFYPVTVHSGFHFDYDV